MTEHRLDEEFAALRREVRRLRLGMSVAGVALMVLTVAAFRTAQPGVLRARGLVIVDASGRDRILIGAPIPASTGRVRTDSARVARIWGPRFPKAYATYYQSYRHSMHGMLVLDERGFDRLAIGDSVPDPNIGRRLGASTGLVINDSLGFERTGYGKLTVGGVDRVVLGLDRNDGTEGLTLSLFDGGDMGLSAYSTNGRRVFLGVTPPESTLGLRDTTRGLLLLRGRDVVHRLTTDSPVRR